MKKAKVYINEIEAGTLFELDFGKRYRFEYKENYRGTPVSLTMPVSQSVYEINSIPPFFDGLLPEGYQLDGLLKLAKIDRNDLLTQVLAVGDDLVGNVTVKEIER